MNPRHPMVHRWQRWAIATLLTPATLMQAGIGWALPPEEDTPEEILRTEIILDARSPIDGSPMTPAEYAEWEALQRELAELPPHVSPQVENLVQLLKLRRLIKRFLPIIPIK